MRMGLLALATLLLTSGWIHAGEEPAPDPVEAALRAPPATGLLVRFVQDASLAQRSGVRPGDVIVGYDGTAIATLEDLRAALAGAGDKEGAIALVVVRAGKRTQLQVQAGALGIQPIAVVKGKPPAPLPPRTLEGIEAAAWKAILPRESWYVFSLDGKQPAGFEHATLALVDGMLVLDHEVGFDGGAQWGLNHQRVQASVEIGSGGMRPRTTRYENVLDGWVGSAELAKDGNSWTVRWPPVQGEPQEKALPLRNGLPVIPSYLVEAVAECMPRTSGACLHYRPFNEGMGTLGLPSALVVTGSETLEHAGTAQTAWKIELRVLGAGTSSTYWVSKTGRVLRIHYGGAWAWRSTREEALRDLPEGLGPKTAGDD